MSLPINRKTLIVKQRWISKFNNQKYYKDIQNDNQEKSLWDQKRNKVNSKTTFNRWPNRANVQK